MNTSSLRRRVTGLAAGLVTAIAALSLQTGTAMASSEGCTYTKFPAHYVCFGIVGSSTYVDDFYVTRGKMDSDNGICNWQARVTVRTPSGYVYTYWSPKRWGCDTYRVKYTFDVNRHYPHNSRACGSFFENGVLQDTACNYIYK